MPGDRLSRAVPFPEFAPDHVLRFTTADLIALEAAVHDREEGQRSASDLKHAMENPWLKEIEKLLIRNDAAFVRQAIKVGLKAPGGFERPKLTDDVLNDLPFSPAEVVVKVFDAILCAITGQSYVDRLAARETANEAPEEAPASAAA